jgi:hypothetical protein
MNRAADSSSSMVLKNMPPATTTVPGTATGALPVEEQKEVRDPEADPHMPNLPEVTEKDQQEEATATKPGILHFLFERVSHSQTTTY